MLFSALPSRPLEPEVSRPCYHLDPHPLHLAQPAGPSPGGHTSDDEVLVAAGEAVANAIEHGRRHSPEGAIGLGTTTASSVAMTVPYLPCAASVQRMAVRPDEIACPPNGGMRIVFR